MRSLPLLNFRQSFSTDLGPCQETMVLRRLSGWGIHPYQQPPVVCSSHIASSKRKAGILFRCSGFSFLFASKNPRSRLFLTPKEGGKSALFRVRNSKSCLSHVFCSSCAIRMGVIYWFLDKSNGLSGETEKKRRCFGKV